MLGVGFTEEEAFWLVAQIMETTIPMDYYTNMLGLATDQSIFCEILKQRLPKIGEKIGKLGLNAEVFSIQWFVCLFTATIPHQVGNLLDLACGGCLGSVVGGGGPCPAQNRHNPALALPTGHPRRKIIPYPPPLSSAFIIWAV